MREAVEHSSTAQRPRPGNRDRERSGLSQPPQLTSELQYLQQNYSPGSDVGCLLSAKLSLQRENEI